MLLLIKLVFQHFDMFVIFSDFIYLHIKFKDLKVEKANEFMWYFKNYKR